MAQMIDDLLNLARLDRHQMVLKMTPLNALVENVITDLESETGGAKDPMGGRSTTIDELRCRLDAASFCKSSKAVKYTGGNSLL
jgi:signal transduction histidine kinase